MIEHMTGLFLSFFANPNPFGIGLAFYFGAFWLIPYWPPLFSDRRLWVVMVTSAFLALAPPPLLSRSHYSFGLERL